MPGTHLLRSIVHVVFETQAFPTVAVISTPAVPIQIFGNGVAPVSSIGGTKPKFPILQAAAHRLVESSHGFMHRFADCGGDINHVLPKKFGSVMKPSPPQIFGRTESDGIAGHEGAFGMCFQMPYEFFD